MLDDMAARRGLGMLVKRGCRLTAGPNERGIIHRLNDFTGQIIAAIGHALRFQPAKMVDCFARIKITLGLISAGAAGHFQISGKILCAVFKTRGTLHLCAAAAAEINLAA